MMERYLLALDQGTTSSRCILFNRQGEAVSKVQREFSQIFPREGWVEHDATEIWASQMGVALEAMLLKGIGADEIAAIGITNQRETTVVWEKETGKPICNAIVWQCRRTAELCEELKRQGLEETVRARTGLLIDPYFSATKLRWILDQVPGAQSRAEKGELLFGTVDSWLIYQLTGGRVHATDPSNAARTMLFNIHTMQWDEELLRIFRIPACMLPRVLPSSGIFGYTDPALFGKSIPIAGVAGDQQAALFGQCGFASGDAKNTYGTGGFLLMNTGDRPITPKQGLLSTVGWQIGERTSYVLEGSVFVCGAVIQWLRDGLGIIDSASECAALAMSVKDNGGVYFVPAFSGLGAPHHDPYARGMVIGLTRGTTRAHIVRAADEAMAYQVADLAKLMEKDTATPITLMRCDGGAVRDKFLMQFGADMMNIPIEIPDCTEATVRGAAFAAAVGLGFADINDAESLFSVKTRYIPTMNEENRTRLQNEWHRAIERAKKWQE